MFALIHALTRGHSTRTGEGRELIAGLKLILEDIDTFP